MICMNCGRELLSLGELDNDLYMRFVKYNTEITDSVISMKNIPLKFMKKGDVYNFVINALRGESESTFLLDSLIKSIESKYNCKNVTVIDGYVYIHGEDK